MTTSSTLHSAACNFLSYVSTGVDPRTGQYTCGLSLPELNGNGLAGPRVPLRFAFSPLNTLDSGYGLGWTLALTQYHTGTGMLSLASGESFKVTGTSGDGKQLLMEELKLDSVRLYMLDEDHFRVVHKSGLIEELSTEGDDPLALPEFMYSPQGHRVSLAYSVYNDGRMLRSITDGDGRVLLEITRQPTSVRLVQHPRSDHEALFSLILQGSEHRVGRIELPTGNFAGWRFQYQTWQGLQCISRVEGPMGGHEQVWYDDGEHLFPDGERRLPRVHRHLHDPGPGQPVIETRYDYSGENFLGYNAPGLSWEDDGRDNLYQVTANYTYWTTEQLWDSVNNRAVRSVKRIFNRFHLLVEETTTQGDCVKWVKNDYHILDGEKFRDQPPQCQLPSKATTTWYRISESGRMREDVVSTRFDDHGNLIQRIDADGITEHNEYYPAAGDDGCPADPHGFVRNLRWRLVTPASADFSDAPSVRSDYRYVAQPPIAGGSHEWLAQELEVLTQVEGSVELQRTRKLYINQPDDAFLHGRLAKTEVFIDGKGTFTDYFHSRTRGRHASEDVWRSVEMHSTSFDLTSKTITRERSLYDGQPLLALDDDAVEIAYRYDRLGRVVEETVAPDTPWSAVRSYDYVLVAQTGGRASQTLTDVQQVKTRSTLDGLQRVVLEERQDVDGDPLNKPFRTLASQQYNAFGQLQASHAVDWLGDTDLTLSSTYTYDDWGERASVRGPDGVVEHRFLDPINRRLRTWTEASDGEVHGIVEVVTNRFDKPLSEERFNRQGQRVSGRYQRYDGLGRGRQDTDELYNNTFYFFDAWSRVGQVVLPDESRVEREYASHSSAELPVRLRVMVDGEAPVLLGEQQFDGLERLTRVDIGPRNERYLYQGGHAQPSERHTAAGRSLHYRYTPQLTRQPTAVEALDEQAGYDYDRYTAQLRAAWNSRGRREFDYDGANNLSAERWIADGHTFESRYSHSREGRPLLHTDVNGLEQRCDYDDFGRLERVTQGNLEVDYAYDTLSRPWLTTCHDLQAGSELSTRLAFDEHGREIERTLTLDGLPVQTISQAWRLDDRLESRHQRRGEDTLLLETFAYDSRGRLVEHLCSGSETPLDRYGNRIAEQHFEFDALDNLVKVDTLFADGSRDECVRRFAVDDPSRLVQVSHSHADYPASLELDYDADGHLLADELGQSLDYDSQGRLQRVRAAEGAVLVEYQYDAHDQLCGETRAGQAPTLRFYHGERLGCTVQDATRISYLHDGDRPLGQQQPDQAENTLLLLTGANRSVIGESQDHALRETTYSAYGERGNEAMQSQLGFNGELRDSQTGWYLLGNGYRAYNPWLMCFHSPDSLSPFGAGGLNPYMYCAGDPVNFRDPSGHITMPTWVGVGGLLLGVAGAALSAGWAGPALASFYAGTLTGGQALALVSFTSGVASIGMEVTAEVGTSDRHARGALRLGAMITGAISLVTGFGTLGVNKGKWRPEKAVKSTPPTRSSFTSSYNGPDPLDNVSLDLGNFQYQTRNALYFDDQSLPGRLVREIPMPQANQSNLSMIDDLSSPSTSSASSTVGTPPRQVSFAEPPPTSSSASSSRSSSPGSSRHSSISEDPPAEVAEVRDPKRPVSLSWSSYSSRFPNPPITFSRPM